MTQPWENSAIDPEGNLRPAYVDRERTQAGLRAARARGRNGKRPLKLCSFPPPEVAALAALISDGRGIHAGNAFACGWQPPDNTLI